MVKFFRDMQCKDAALGEAKSQWEIETHGHSSSYDSKLYMCLERNALWIRSGFAKVLLCVLQGIFQNYKVFTVVYNIRIQ